MCVLYCVFPISYPQVFKNSKMAIVSLGLTKKEHFIFLTSDSFPLKAFFHPESSNKQTRRRRHWACLKQQDGSSTKGIGDRQQKTHHQLGISKRDGGILSALCLSTLPLQAKFQ